MKPLGKKAALALVSSGITYGDLRRSIDAGKDRSGLSKLNPGMTVAQSADILRKAIASKPDGETVEATRWSVTRDRHVTSSWAIIASNILREFGAPPA